MKEPLKILIVEDHWMFRQVLRDMILWCSGSAQIEEAAYDLEAMEKVQRFLPDLIFMDIRLPAGIDGLELTRRIKADHPKIAVVVITAFDFEEYRRLALGCGADRFIVKGSIESEQIREIIRLAVSRGLIR